MISFYASRRDSSRNMITVEELCYRKWEFRFKEWFNFVPEEEEEMLETQFYNNFTCMTSISYDIMPWQFIFSEETNAYHIQVADYTPLAISRLENWGWQLDNPHVVLTSHLEL